MSTSEPTFNLFGYGSLIFSPELPDAVVDRIPARLDGFARRFNKRSQSRGCALAESFDAFPGLHPDFVVGGLNHSLVLGTEADPNNAIVGVVLAYSREARETVLGRTDPREDYAPDRPTVANGYLRRPVQLTCLQTQRRLEAWTYLTNDLPGAAWAAPTELTREDRAKLLINATPILPRSTSKRREARGLYYLEAVRADLRGLAIVDHELEALADAIRQLPGEWVQRIR